MSLYFNGGSISAGSGGGSDDTYTKAEINGLLSAKSNTGLDNLNADGQMIIDSQNGTISNCILEIPQNLKLTLENNVLTVKAGSILTRDGSTYSTVTINTDFSATYNYGQNNHKYVIFGSSGALQGLIDITSIRSGTSFPETAYANWVFYNTDDKKIYLYNGNTQAWVYWGVCYPLCILERQNGVFSFAKDSNGNDMIFNGAGFIGHHAFVYPNVKGLVGDGYNEDGTLKSSIANNTSLLIQGMSTIRSDFALSMGGSGVGIDIWNFTETDDPSTLTNYQMAYIKQENKTYGNIGSGAQVYRRCYLFTAAYNGTTVTDFTIRQPYEGARDLLTDNKQDVLTSITGYDSTQTQTLKNINGVLQWVTD